MLVSPRNKRKSRGEQNKLYKTNNKLLPLWVHFVLELDNCNASKLLYKSSLHLLLVLQVNLSPDVKCTTFWHHNSHFSGSRAADRAAQPGHTVLDHPQEPEQEEEQVHGQVSAGDPRQAGHGRHGWSLHGPHGDGGRHGHATHPGLLRRPRPPGPRGEASHFADQQDGQGHRV